MLHSEISLSPRFTTPIHQSQNNVELSADEIRARIKQIKSRWTPSERRERALIGYIRRAELLALCLGDDQAELSNSAPETFSLVCQ
jgi:hypothetical protein